MKAEQLLKIIGRNISHHRQSRGWTQAELAKYSGINRSYLASIEAGRRNISINTLVILANSLSIHPQILINNNDDINEEHIYAITTT